MFSPGILPLVIFLTLIRYSTSDDWCRIISPDANQTFYYGVEVNMRYQSHFSNLRSKLYLRCMGHRE